MLGPGRRSDKRKGSASGFFRRARPSEVSGSPRGLAAHTSPTFLRRPPSALLPRVLPRTPSVMAVTGEDRDPEGQGPESLPPPSPEVRDRRRTPARLPFWGLRGKRRVERPAPGLAPFRLGNRNAFRPRPLDPSEPERLSSGPSRPISQRQVYLLERPSSTTLPRKPTLLTGPFCSPPAPGSLFLFLHFPVRRPSAAALGRPGSAALLHPWLSHFVSPDRGACGGRRRARQRGPVRHAQG